MYIEVDVVIEHTTRLAAKCVVNMYQCIYRNIFQSDGWASCKTFEGFPNAIIIGQIPCEGSIYIGNNLNLALSDVFFG